MADINVLYYSICFGVLYVSGDTQENQNDCDSKLMDRFTVKGRFSPVVRIPAGSKLG